MLQNNAKGSWSKTESAIWEINVNGCWKQSKPRGRWGVKPSPALHQAAHKKRGQKSGATLSWNGSVKHWKWLWTGLVQPERALLWLGRGRAANSNKDEKHPGWNETLQLIQKLENNEGYSFFGWYLTPFFPSSRYSLSCTLRWINFMTKGYWWPVVLVTWLKWLIDGGM